MPKKQKKSVPSKTIDLTKQFLSNNVALQSKITELLISLNRISNQLEKLVKVFEQAGAEAAKEEVPGVAQRIEAIERQNKAIADAIIALESHFRRAPLPIAPVRPSFPEVRQIPQTLPTLPQPPKLPSPSTKPKPLPR